MKKIYLTLKNMEPINHTEQGISERCAYSVTSYENTAGSPLGSPVKIVIRIIGCGFSRVPTTNDSSFVSVTTNAMSD